MFFFYNLSICLLSIFSLIWNLSRSNELRESSPYSLVADEWVSSLSLLWYVIFLISSGKTDHRLILISSLCYLRILSFIRSPSSIIRTMFGCLVFWLTGHCILLLPVCSVKLSVMSKVNPSKRPLVWHILLSDDWLIVVASVANKLNSYFWRCFC